MRNNERRIPRTVLGRAKERISRALRCLLGRAHHFRYEHVETFVPRGRARTGRLPHGLHPSKLDRETNRESRDGVSRHIYLFLKENMRRSVPTLHRDASHKVPVDTASPRLPLSRAALPPHSPISPHFPPFPPFQRNGISSRMNLTRQFFSFFFWSGLH